MRVLPALAGIGAPWWRPDARAVIAGATSATRPGHVARAALEAIAWRVADVLVAVRESVPVEVLRVDGGLTRSELLLSMQADAAGVAVQPGAVDATAAGAAALAAVGAGIWESTLEIGERIPAGERVEPGRDDAWREREHAAWRQLRRARRGALKAASDQPREDVLGALDMFADQPNGTHRVPLSQQPDQPPVLLRWNG